MPGQRVQIDERQLRKQPDWTYNATDSGRVAGRPHRRTARRSRGRRCCGGAAHATAVGSAPWERPSEFVEQRQRRFGLPGTPEWRIGSRRDRHPGVVGRRRQPHVRRRTGLAGPGFVALVPDLYHGDVAGHDEMDKAAQLMQSLPADRAARDMSGAVDFLAGHEAVTGDGVGVVGFCMGGMLTWILAANRPGQGEGRGRVLRLPAGRHGAGLVASSRPRCRGTWRRTTTSSDPRAPRHSSRS